MIERISRYFEDLVHLLFPKVCLGCGHLLKTSEEALCTNCRLQLPEMHLNPNLNQLHKRFAGKVSIRYVSAYLQFAKGGIVQRLIHQIKYRGQKEAGTIVGRWFGNQLAQDEGIMADVEVLIPVPLHRSRLKQRGYNQAAYIANGMAQSLQKEMDEKALVRKAFNSSQTQKNRVERWENVNTVFEVSTNANIRNKHVLLVDDVLTTGATLEACAVALLAAGCSRVSIAALAAAQ